MSEWTKARSKISRRRNAVSPFYRDSSSWCYKRRPWPQHVGSKMRLPWLRNGDNRRRCRNNAYVTRAVNYAKCNVYPRAWNGAMHLLFFWHRVYPLDDSASLLDDNTCPAAKLQTIVVMQSFFPTRQKKRDGRAFNFH